MLGCWMWGQARGHGMGRHCYLGFVGPFMCREGGWERSQLGGRRTLREVSGACTKSGLALGDRGGQGEVWVPLLLGMKSV